MIYKVIELVEALKELPQEYRFTTWTDDFSIHVDDENKTVYLKGMPIKQEPSL